MNFKEFFKILLFFIFVFLVSFTMLYVIIDPIVQDAYNKGYQRGINETCRAEWFFLTQSVGNNPEKDDYYNQLDINGFFQPNNSLNFPESPK